MPCVPELHAFLLTAFLSAPKDIPFIVNPFLVARLLLPGFNR